MRIRLVVAVLAGLSAAGSAAANPMDLTLSRLYDEAACTNPGNAAACADQEAFRSLAAQYGLAVAPQPIVPAETLGYAGFYFALEGSITTIDSSTERDNVWRRGTEDQNPDSVLFVPSLHIRKGLPFSFELGTAISYVSATEQVLIGADIRWALLEGYREGWKGYFPDIAIRGAVNRLTGEDELDLTVIGLDVLLSRPFSVSGVMTFTPYAGYQWVRIIADNSLTANAMPDPAGGNYLDCDADTEYQTNCVGGVTGPDLRYLDFSRENIDRHRLLFGVRFLWEHLTAILQYGVSLDSVVATQHQFGVSIGMDY